MAWHPSLMKRGCSVSTHRTTRKRKTYQRRRKQLALRREDDQLAGRIPTTPEGAVLNERVNPLLQGEQPLPQIALMAIEGDRKGSWKVPAEKKPELVDEMIDLIEATGEGAPSPVVKVMAYNAVVKGDQLQYERDNPDAAGRAKGGVKVAVGVGVFGSIGDLLKRAREQRDGVNNDIRETDDGTTESTIHAPRPEGRPTVAVRDDQSGDLGGGEDRG